jgi:nitroimidazol reductase NimA-like FMN-containing flavoprotein (pyridoxamine 5'-phosphate oxidase superfamily)
VGRLAVHSGALPVILPVNFLLTGCGIVIRTAEGTKLDAALRNAVVAFEADEFDEFGHTGWSVVVTGVAEEVTDPDEVAAMRALPLPHWAPGRADRYLRISLELVSGRKIIPVSATMVG